MELRFPLGKDKDKPKISLHIAYRIPISNGNRKETVHGDCIIATPKCSEQMVMDVKNLIAKQYDSSVLISSKAWPRSGQIIITGIHRLDK